MHHTLATNLLVALACAAVAVVLFMGLYNTWRGGDPNLSQKLMRWRIGLQALAIVIIMGVLFFRHQVPVHQVPVP